MNQFLTVEQAADRLQMHPETVRRQLRRGALRGVKHGREWRVPEDALMEGSPPASVEDDDISPLARGLAMILERDAREGPVPICQDGSALTDLHAVREENTP